MSIRKLRAGRVPNVTANNWVGEYGTLFYDEATGQFKIADGVTPGGRYVALVIATPTVAGAIKAGPGANVSADGTLTIDTTGLPLSFGDFTAIGGNLTVVNPNESMNLVTNGSGSINLIGNVKVYATTGNSYPDNKPFFTINQAGQIKILVNGTDVSNGAVEIIGTTSQQAYPPINVGVMLHITGQNGTPSRFYNDGIGAPATFVGRRINNLVASPQAVLAGDDIIRISSTGYNGNNVPGTASARITFFATENWTTSNFGGNISFSVVNNGTTTATEVANVSVSNGVSATRFTGPLYGNVTTTGNLNVGNITLTGNLVGTTIGNISTVGNIVANYANIGNIIIGNNAIQSALGNADLDFGSLTATANVNINRTAVFKKESYFVGNIHLADTNITASGFNKTGGTVTANGMTGQLTTNADNLAKGVAGTFTVNSTYVSSKDVVIVNIASGGSTNSYAIAVTAVANGSFQVTITNSGAGALAEALVINYAILKIF